VPTPEENIDRVARLQGAYEELKNDMLEEISMMEARIIRPAMDARESLQPLKKVIKKRQDKKVWAS
jgi:amphiphysin